MQMVVLMEIQSALEKVKDPKEVLCGKCLKSPQTASSYCCDCSEFICTMCMTIHSQWGDFAEHEVVAIEQLEQKANQFDALKKVTICNLVGDNLVKHKAEITASLEPIEKLLDVVSKALEQFDLRSQELDDLQITVEASIQQQIHQLQELLEARKTELTSHLQQLIQMKRKNLPAQKDEVETVHTQLASCLSFVRESLRTGSQREVMQMKKAIVKQMKEMTDNFKPGMLTSCEPAHIRFKPLSDLTQPCQQFGKVYLQHISPEKCYATGKGLKVAEIGETAAAILHIVDDKGKPCTTFEETPTCQLVSEDTCEKIDCTVANQYKISYQATSRGRHHLHITVEGKDIKGSPFPVTVKLPVQKLGTPIKTISGLEMPWGVAVNQRGEIIVAESSGNCVSIFGQTGEKICTLGSQGSGDGLLKTPLGIVVDDGGNILVVDNDNHRVQKFTSDGEFITAIGKRGEKVQEFQFPCGIGIHPTTGKIYVADQYNHRIQILKPDLTFSCSFGSYGSDNGQFQFPLDVAFDSTGNVYVADSNNHCIQTFTAEGKFLRKFSKQENGNGELKYPYSIAVSSGNVYVTETNNHRVSVFTCEGKFQTSFGTQGSGLGQFNNPHGIAVDKAGVVYVSDTHNHRLQIF